MVVGLSSGIGYAADLQPPRMRLLIGYSEGDGYRLIGFPGSTQPRSRLLVTSPGIEDTVAVEVQEDGSFDTMLSWKAELFELSVSNEEGVTSSPLFYPDLVPMLRSDKGYGRAPIGMEGFGTFDLVPSSVDTAKLHLARRAHIAETGGLPDSLFYPIRSDELEPILVYGKVPQGKLVTFIVRHTGRSFVDTVSSAGHYSILVPVDAIVGDDGRYAIVVTDGDNGLVAASPMNLLPQSFFRGRAKEERHTRALLGTTAPVLHLPDLRDTQFHDVGPTSDRVTLIATWASWCAPCKPELAFFQELHQQPSTNLAVIGVAVDKDPSDALNAATEMGLTFPVFIDTTYAMKKAYAAYGIPHVAVIDLDGRIAWLNSGRQHQRLEEALMTAGYSPGF